MSGSLNLFLVNETTNYHWQKRFDLIQVLAQWVCKNLNPNTVKWKDSNSYHKKDTANGRMVKAHQYVYEYMAVGKMFHPTEKFDPLFTLADYQDESMEKQLAPGKYPEFQRYVRSMVRTMHSQFKQTGRTFRSVSWAALVREMSDENRRVMDMMRAYLCTQANEKNIKANWVDQQMIGLVLRYKCMGAFSDNLHASVPVIWKETLGDDWVECFASPFNHKFDKYFSIYDQDKPFGSMGNFFSMIEQNEGILPLCAKYEINPPWNNQIYERVQEILAKTMSCDAPIEAIVMGPNWSETKWIPGITRMISDNECYTEHSFVGVRSKMYQNDLTQRVFPLTTVFWVISRCGLDNDVLKALDLQRPVHAHDVVQDFLRYMQSVPGQ